MYLIGKETEECIHIYKISVKHPSNSGPDSKFYDKFNVSGFYETSVRNAMIKTKRLISFIINKRKSNGNFKPGILEMNEWETKHLNLDCSD
jgi:hypothetical protein